MQAVAGAVFGGKCKVSLALTLVKAGDAFLRKRECRRHVGRNEVAGPFAHRKGDAQIREVEAGIVEPARILDYRRVAACANVRQNLPNRCNDALGGRPSGAEDSSHRFAVARGNDVHAVASSGTPSRTPAEPKIRSSSPRTRASSAIVRAARCTRPLACMTTGTSPGHSSISAARRSI